MSFSGTLKTELCDIRMSECCKNAVCCGFLLFGHCFSHSKISMLTDEAAVSHHYANMLRHCFKIKPLLTVSGSKKTMYKVSIENGQERNNIINSYIDTKDGKIRDDIIRKDCCKDAFLRGVFLACGQASDPQKAYRIDLRIKNSDLTDFLYDLMLNRGLYPKHTKRNGTDVLYFKKSSSVEDFLTVIGAAPTTLEVIDTKILKEVRADINRRNNADDANISKVINASINQRTAINNLIEKGKFDILSPELQEVAMLRMANPEASLSELCRLYSMSITRSGMNHRMSKIMEIAKKYSDKGD